MITTKPTSATNLQKALDQNLLTVINDSIGYEDLENVIRKVDL